MDLLADLTVEPRLAPIKYRISAAIIDFLILWLVSFLMGYLFGEYYITDDSMVSPIRVSRIPYVYY